MRIELRSHNWTWPGTEDFLVRYGGMGPDMFYFSKTLILMGDWCSED